MAVVTPYVLRGKLYPSAWTARCPLFFACEVCAGCRRYDPTSAVCIACESDHKAQMICRHRPDTLLTVRRITEKLGRPMTHPDIKPGQTRVIEPDVGEEVTRLAERFKITEE